MTWYIIVWHEHYSSVFVHPNYFKYCARRLIWQRHHYTCLFPPSLFLIPFSLKTTHSGLEYAPFNTCLLCIVSSLARPILFHLKLFSTRGDLTRADLGCPTFRGFFLFVDGLWNWVAFLNNKCKSKKWNLKKNCTYPTIEKTVFFHEIRVKMTAKNGTKRLDAAIEGGVKKCGPTITDKHMTRD